MTCPSVSPIPALRAFALIAVSLAGYGQCTSVAINNSQTLSGTLSSACVSTHRAGRFARLFTFNANATDTISVAVNSTAFDAYANLIAPSGLVVASDDDSGANHNALIRIVAATTGAYTAEVTSYDSGATGGFTIIVTVAAAALPTISSSGIVTGARFNDFISLGPGFSSTIASGSWISLLGSNFTAITRVWTQSDFKGTSLPLSLDGVSVKVNNKDAPIYSISPSQIIALAPADSATGSVTITVTNPKGTSAPVQATLQPTAPAWFVFAAQAGTFVVAEHEDGTYVGSSGLFGNSAISAPARSNETITLFCTGLGPTTPGVDPLTSFSGAAPLQSLSDLHISIGGQPATVSFAGLVSNGVYEIGVVVPSVSDGDQSVIASIGGAQTKSARLTTLTPPPPPTITTMSPNDLVWGQTASVQLAGTSMNGASAVVFSDASNLRITSPVSATSTSVSFTLVVDGGAVEGQRTLTITGPNGTSNPISFNVRAGNPALTQFQPAIVYLDRIYTSSTVYTDNKSNLLTITGADLAGVQSVAFSPSPGLLMDRGNTATSVFGRLYVSATTATGLHEFTVTSPSGTSNALTFDVEPPPPTAPVISDVTLNIPTTSSGGFITYSGSIKFTDSDGDIVSGKTGAYLRFIATADTSSISLFPQLSVGAFDATGSFLDFAGQTSGTINFSYETRPLLVTKFFSATPVAVTLIDSAGNPSNSVTISVPSWIVPLI